MSVTEASWSQPRRVPPPALSAELRRLLASHWDFTQGGLAPNTSSACLEMASEDRAAEVLDMVGSCVPFPLSGRRLLELGAGVGAIQVVAQRKGVDSYGLEPSATGTSAAKQFLTERGLDPSRVMRGVGEHLPFPSETFDVVCSSQVLEHVRNPELVMEETVRVLKPEGYFVHSFPNYGSFWEGHYGVPWIPHIPKILGLAYVKLLRRDLAMMQELRLLSHGSTSRIVNKIPNIMVTDWGMDLWERRLRTLEFSEWAALARLKGWVRWLHRLHLVSALVRIGRVLHFETPIVLVGMKLHAATR
jgi:SAM-dependent methyltransferase